jgi:predicted O-linked N-acetylglucosamine transferase (SPINDLY family)
LLRRVEFLLGDNRRQEAEELFHRLRHSVRESASGCRVFALLCAAGGDCQGAELALRRSLAYAPSAAGYRDLGAILAARGDWSGAVSAFRSGLQLRPRDLHILRSLGDALLSSNSPQEAAEVFGEAVALEPRNGRLLLRLADALYLCRDWNGIQTALLAAIEIGETRIAALKKLATLYFRLGYFREARELFDELVTLDPADANAKRMLGAASVSAGEIEDSLALMRAEVDSGSAGSAEHSAYLGVLLHSPLATAASLRAAHEEWAARFAPAQLGPAVWTRPAAGRRIRAGFHSGEFTSGPAYYFIHPFFEAMDKGRFETFCYHTAKTSDDKTAFFQDVADHWRESQPLAKWAKTIKDDGLDLLVDLSGHWGRNHFSCFTERLASVHATFPNYPSTTGLRAIDYIITDRWVCPPGLESQYVEQPYFVSAGYLPYSAPALLPAVRPLPADANGYITFGLFQRPLKLNSMVWDSVANILNGCAGSRLLIHYSSGALDLETSEERLTLTWELERRGIGRNRVQFAGAAPLSTHLEFLASVDVVLDTFPYNGQTTTCECLLMGAPVVTMTGQVHIARVGYQLLDRIGLGEFAADTPVQYCRIARDLANNLPGLRELRQALRSRILRSPLMNGEAAQGILDAFEGMLNASIRN